MQPFTILLVVNWKLLDYLSYVFHFNCKLILVVVIAWEFCIDSKNTFSLIKLLLVLSLPCSQP